MNPRIRGGNDWPRLAAVPAATFSAWPSVQRARQQGRIKAKLTKGLRELDTAVNDLTTQIHQAAGDEERLRIFLSKDWAFGLATATAVLTVLFPDRFTVYDVRVRGQLNIKDFCRPDRPDRAVFQRVPA